MSIQTSKTPYRCILCGSPVLALVEEDGLPPFKPHSFLSCSRCGEHHGLDDRRLYLLHRPYDSTPTEVSQEEAAQWAARGGCQAICGRAYPWEG